MINQENLEALLEGLAVMGTGGGGSPDWGRAVLAHDFELGRSVEVVDPEDVPDDAFVCSGGMMGSVKVLDRMEPTDLIHQWDQHFELAEAVDLMEDTIGRKIDYLVPCELGGLNTPIILSLGARTGRPVIDGDGLGRASPATHMVAFIGFGISLTPMPLVDVDGNAVVVRQGKKPTFADDLGRWVITQGNGLGANSHYPMTGAQLKRAIIPNTISSSLSLGKAILEARQNGMNPVIAAADHLNGHLIHTGAIESITEGEEEGFFITRVNLTGDVEILIKNEAMALSKKGRLVTIFPDLICMLDPSTGHGLMSAHLKVEDEISIIVAPCHPRLRAVLETDIGCHAFSPANFGLPEFGNPPLEELLKQSEDQ